MNDLMSRRDVMTELGALALAVALPMPVLAASQAQAENMIVKVVADIQKIINSGRSEAQMLVEFEKVFSSYADVDYIGRLVLGPVARSASDAQNSAFAQAFKGYIARKYGRRFREFIGGTVSVQSSSTVKSFYEVDTLMSVPGSSPWSVVFVVADRSGKFIDLRIEGISLIKSEREEIGAMLDKRGGDLNKLTADLKAM